MKYTFKQRHIASFAALAVFLLFALCVTCVLLSGAGVYRRLVQQGGEDHAQRTCGQYIATRIHQCRHGDLVSVEPFGNTCALVLREHVDGTDYLTRVYYYDGWLMELFAAAQEEFQPEDGEKLLPARALEFELEGGLLRTVVVDEFGTQTEGIFALRGREEGRT